ncbi:CoA-binding protein [Massilia sp. W12]|uniref:CoA-binding protein n=1 Tax=Massilia sp. W12 TaxID=3126507 RepID=UPI0030D06F99
MNQYSPEIASILGASRTIAVVGLSAQSTRTSYEVASYMQKHGYRIIPVNPTYAGQQILGETCYPDLPSAASALAAQGQRIDIVNVFRRSEDVPPVTEQAIAITCPCIWLQLGISHAQAAQQAQAQGMQVVMNRCIKIDHMHWRSQQRLTPKGLR